MMSSRLDLAKSFLGTTCWAGSEPVPFVADASARRYFRLSDPRAAVLMDAPKEGGQDIAPFVRIAGLLIENGFSAPKVYAEDHANGFLLLEDLGDDVFADVIKGAPTSELSLYRAALDILNALGQMTPPSDLPHFTPDVLSQMIDPAFTWYRWAILGETGDPQDVRDHMKAALSDIDGFELCLRDFHAENLIWLPERTGVKRVGLLDFQDAMIGPKGYDLISLLYDARRDVSDTTIETIQAEYAAYRNLNLAEAKIGLAALTLQRNLRILGVFVRLALKMNKARYLDFLPRVWRYVEQSAAHPGLEQLGDAVRAALPPPTQEVIEELRSRCGSVPDR